MVSAGVFFCIECCLFVAFVHVCVCVTPFPLVSRICFCHGGSSSVCDCFSFSCLLHCSHVVFYVRGIDESCKDDEEEEDEDEDDAFTSKRRCAE